MNTSEANDRDSAVAPKGQFRVVWVDISAADGLTGFGDSVFSEGDFATQGEAQRFAMDPVERVLFPLQVYNDTGECLLYVGGRYVAHDPRIEGVWLVREMADAHTDARRQLTDVTVDINRVPRFFHEVRASGQLQVKTLTFTEKAVADGRPVGDHFHTEQSGRFEQFIAGGPKGVDLFHFRYGLPHGDVIGDAWLQNGEGCIICPGVAHSFVPLVPGVVLNGLSNREYDSSHDVSHPLF